MSKQAAVNAYRDSLYNALEYQQEARIGSRSVPIVGGLWPALKIIGNVLFRPVKIGGALLFGGSEDQAAPEKPVMPSLPEEFKGTQLGKDLEESWKLRTTNVETRTEAFSKLVDLDIGGWWRKASVAQHNEAIDRHRIMPEEGEAMQRAASGNDHRWTSRVAGDLAAKAITGMLGR